jgi:dCTP deaminase
MSYWSGEKLISKIETNNLIIPFKKELIDCAAYTLSVGDEAFVSQDFIDAQLKPIKKDLITKRSENLVNIEPGQFAFLLTLECVTVPVNAIAFISIRAKYKFKGLVNISGFHVDPGYSGKLIFSVYNAGPGPIIVQRGEPLFLIFYADLDNKTSYKKKDGIGSGIKEIASGLIQNMAGQVFSPLLLQRKMVRLEDSQTELKRELSTIISSASIILTLTTTLMTVVITIAISMYNSDSVKVLVGGWIKDAIAANENYKKQ